MTGLVYLAECLATGKCYVGFTTRTLAQRRAEHEWAAVNTYRLRAVHAAMRKHGLASFRWSVLAAGLPVPVALALESVAIQAYKTLAPCGYNLNTGGTVNLQASEETRARIAASRRGDRNPMKSSAARAKMSLNTSARRVETQARMSANHRLRRPEQRAAQSAALQKLRPAQAANVAMLLALGARQRDVGCWFNVNPSVASYVKHGQRGYGVALARFFALQMAA